MTLCSNPGSMPQMYCSTFKSQVEYRFGGVSILELTLTAKWFEMIFKGIKKEEYRELKEYWTKRLAKYYEENEKGYKFSPKQFDILIFTNGYGENMPKMAIRLESINIGKGQKDWGATEEECLILKLGQGLIYSNCEKFR